MEKALQIQGRVHRLASASRLCGGTSGGKSSPPAGTCAGCCLPRQSLDATSKVHEPGEVFLATSRREAPLILNDESEGPVIALYRLTSRVWQRISRHFSVMQYRKWSRRRESHGSYCATWRRLIPYQYQSLFLILMFNTQRTWITKVVNTVSTPMHKKE